MGGIHEAVVHIDYFRCTVPGEFRDPGGTGLLPAWEAALRHQGAGHTRVPASRYGFHGSACSGVFLGVKPGWAMLDVSGAAASAACRVVSPHSVRVNRVDIAVTVFGWLDPSRAVRRAKREAVRFRGEGQGDARGKLTFVDGLGGGDTLYVGSRKSQSFARIYDKQRQSGDPAYKGAVRYEVQFNDEYARAVAIRLSECQWGEAECAGEVASWLSGRGLRALFPKDTPLGGCSDVPRRKSDDDTTIRWLDTGVIPAVHRLILAGRREEVRAFLDKAGSLL